MRGFFYIYIRFVGMKKFANLYLVLLILIVIVPDKSNPIDYKGLHWMLWSGLNTVSLAYIFVKSKKVFLPKSPVLISFLLFFVVSCISTVVALNKIESVVKLTDLYVIGSSLFIVYFLIYKKAIDLKFVLWLIAFKLFIELVLVYYQLYYFTAGFTIDFSGGNSQFLKSSYGNKNVTSFAFLIQASLVFVLISYVRAKYIKVLLSLTVLLTIFILFYISTRAVILSISLGIFIIVFLTTIKFIRSKANLLLDFKSFILYILIVASSFLIFNISNQDDDIEITERVSQVIDSVDNESINSRVRFWTHALSSIKEKPILGRGIGNWRIFSTKYDSQNIYSYVVPYSTHNDFLEVFAETGIFGFLSYLAFFFFILKKSFINVFKWTKLNLSINHAFILLCAIYFIIDSTLNFPITRPLMQIVLILFVIVNELIDQNKNLNETI